MFEDRVRQLNDKAPRTDAKFVLYWAQMNRRTEANQALSYAVDLANRLDLPVLFYEGLTCSYPGANDRLHTFLLEGVPDTQRSLEKMGIGYAFYLRRRRKDPDDILYQLARDAAAVVTDDYPTFIARRHNERVPEKLDIPYFVVDASCVVPMGRIGKREYAAYTIRPKIHKLLPEYLKPLPPVRVKHKFRGARPAFHTEVSAGNIADLVASCEVDHRVAPSTDFRGGSGEAQRRLATFLEQRLRRYANERNEPSAHATSQMSPYLHFGHISALTMALEAKEYAKEHKLIAAEFLEELIVRRELAFNFTRYTDRYDSLEVLPEWARESLERHAADKREPHYTAQQLEAGATYDDLWNATQKEMLQRGVIQGYYRMYWGKKIVEWSATPQEAVDTMLAIHDRYALDGRDPNTYTNVLWCLGLHDRPFFERPIFGQVRYMTLAGMKRKTDVEAYIREIAELEQGPAQLSFS